MAHPLKIAWKHPAEELLELYKREGDGQLARGWQALELWRQGERRIGVKQVIGMSHKTIQGWVRWYECGGIGELGWHRWGEPGDRKPAWGEEEKEKLLRRSAEGGFRTIGEAELGKKVLAKSLYAWFRKWWIRTQSSSCAGGEER